jgi:hypothetical protein
MYKFLEELGGGGHENRKAMRWHMKDKFILATVHQFDPRPIHPVKINRSCNQGRPNITQVPADNKQL